MHPFSSDSRVAFGAGTVTGPENKIVLRCVQIESQKVMTAQAAQARQAHGRVAKVRADQEGRVAALARAAADAERAARALEANLDQVNAALAAINAQLASGMSWPDLERLIADERAAGAPLAMLVAALALEEGRATLLLDEGAGEGEGGGEEGDATAPAPAPPRRARKLRVQVDLSLNAHTNAKCALVLCDPCFSMRMCALECVHCTLKVRHLRLPECMHPHFERLSRCENTRARA